MQIKRLCLAISILFLTGSMLHSQDLIKNTQKGIVNERISEPNNIAQEMELRQVESAFEKVSIFQASNAAKNSQHQDINYAVDLEISSAELKDLSQNSRDLMLLEIPVNSSQSFHLELMPVNIFADGFEIKTASGESYAPSGTFYRGIVQGDPSSTATVSIFEDYIRILITDLNGNYIIGPMKNDKNSYILYNDKELTIQNDFQCQVEDDAVKPANLVDPSADNLPGECVNIFMEADFAMFQSNGSNVATTSNFVAALFNEVATVYDNENINIRISVIFVWNIPDPYVGFSNTLDVLSNYRVTRTGYNGNLAAFISTRNIGGGRAYLDVICNTAFSYSVSGNMGTVVTPFPTYSWEVYVLSHELGHNFGSSHTHACVWNGNNTAIDGCAGSTEGSCSLPGTPTGGGTVMSYCHIASVGINLNTGFGPQPGNLIRNRYNAAPCTSPCPVTCPTNLTVTTTYNNGANIVLEASNNITATNIINSGANVDYLAGNIVRLLPGFHARNGSDFYGSIEPCSGQTDSYQGPKQLSDLNQIPTSEAVDESFAGELQISNSPNPFSGQTDIKYFLAEDSEVILYISDYTGKRLSTLVNSIQQPKGEYVITFDGQNQPNGLYYYTIQAGDKIKTGKILLIQ